MKYKFNFTFKVRGNLTIAIEKDDEQEAFAVAQEILEAIALGNSIYPVTDYTIDQKPDLQLERQLPD